MSNGIGNRFAGSTVFNKKDRVISDKIVEIRVKEIIDTPGITVEEKGRRIKDFVSNIKDIEVLDRNPKGGSGTNPTQPDSTPEETLPSFEIDTKLQLLISAIPIANPGNIITSEYHNALRDAVRALASKIGLSVNPTAEFQILTFSPNFLPLTIKDSADVNWNVTLNQATLPQVAANTLVIGGFVVQLPDSATISQMIVRGKRIGAANPTNFQIDLNRLKFDKDLAELTKSDLDKLKLISMDLKTVKEGVFKEEESVKLSKTDADSTNNELLARATISDRKFVNNEAWIYFVTAEWMGAADAAKFEINSIQILCMV